jgi:hypothetical protein
MNVRKVLFSLSSSLVLSLGVVAQAETAPGDTAVRAELEALRARINELETNQNDHWLNERRAEEVKGLIREVLSDADSRASLAGGVTAGHDGKRFFLASEDGTFLLQPSAYVQARYVYNDRDGSTSTGGDDRETGFTIRRMKLGFDGHIGSPKLTYLFVVTTDNNTESIFLDDAIIGYQAMDGVTINVGQGKAPFLREELISDKQQLAVERSLVNELFTVRRVQGIWAKIDANDNAKVALSLNDGVASGDAGDAAGGTAAATNDFDTDASDIAMTARLDLRLAGNWEQWDDFSSWSNEETALFLGAAVHYELGETGDNQASATFDSIVEWTVDASYECNGFNLFGAAVGNSLNGPGAAATTQNYGFVIQGGYMVWTDQLEPFVRYELTNPDGGHDLSIVTFGTNYFVKKHNAKFTADLVCALNSLDQLGGNTGLGLLTDAGGETGQVALRLQFQLVY